MSTQTVVPTPPVPARRRARAQAAQPVTPPTTAALAVTADSGLAPIATLQALKWWPKLNQQEQTVVTEDTIGLATDLRDEHESQVRSGRRLARLQSVLEPHSLFNRYLQHF